MVLEATTYVISGSWSWQVAVLGRQRLLLLRGSRTIAQDQHRAFASNEGQNTYQTTNTIVKKRRICMLWLSIRKSSINLGR